MSFDAHKNLAYSVVATAPSPASSGTSLVVSTGDGSKFPAVPFNATVWPANTQPTTANAEIVRVTGISTDTFTITRTQESTSARTIGVGDQIAATITAKTLSDIEGTGIVRPAGGGLETFLANGNSGSSKTIDLANGNVQSLTLNANCTLTLTGATNGSACTLVLRLIQDGTGGRTVTWPGSVTWFNGVAPILQTGASAIDIITFETDDGGTTWFGFYSPRGGSVKVYDSTLAADTASIDTGANAIPSGYDTIEILIICKTDKAAQQDGADLNFNGDTGTNYDWENNNGAGTTNSVGATVASGTGIGITVTGTGTANYATIIQATIPCYAQTTFYKTGNMQCGFNDSTSGNNRVQNSVFSWRNTAAINQVKIAARSTQKFKAGSRMVVYAR